MCAECILNNLSDKDRIRDKTASVSSFNCMGLETTRKDVLTFFGAWVWYRVEINAYELRSIVKEAKEIAVQLLSPLAWIILRTNSDCTFGHNFNPNQLWPFASPWGVSSEKDGSQKKASINPKSSKRSPRKIVKKALQSIPIRIGKQGGRSRLQFEQSKNSNYKKWWMKQTLISFYRKGNTKFAKMARRSTSRSLIDKSIRGCSGEPLRKKL